MIWVAAIKCEEGPVKDPSAFHETNGIASLSAHCLHAGSHACRRGHSERVVMVRCAFVSRGREFDPALESTFGSGGTRGRHIRIGNSMAAQTS